MNSVLPSNVTAVLLLFWGSTLFSGAFSRRGYDSEYDYIVVGGGSAGSVVASRLSEDPLTSVLLLEAGPRENFITDIPYAAPALQLSPIDWAYLTEPQEHSCFGFNGNMSRWPRGKVMGGSSVLNYMLYVRGNRRDYDHWEQLGAKGWSYSNVLPYFMKAENTKLPDLLANGFHGSKGKLSVERPRFVTPMASAFVEAGKYFGYSEVDYNGPQQTGFAINQGTIKDGSRMSTAKAYIRPVKGSRRNLHVSPDSFVTKILFDNFNRAVGVQFNRKRIRDKTIKARKEVILSAGTINSPQLLLLSGIGPKDHLEELNIPVIADLKGVGSNLQDHICPGTIMFLIKQPLSLLYSRVTNYENVLKYLEYKDGPLTSLGGCEAMGYVKTKFADQNDDYPDIQIQMVGGSTLSDNGTILRVAEGYSDELWAAFEPYKGRESFELHPVLLKPRSSGFVKLRSSNPFDPPIIDPKYLSDPQDIEVLVEAMKLSIKIGLSPPLARFGTTFFNVSMPGCHAFDPMSSEGLACALKAYTFTYRHPVGTCKMGSPADPMAVVDPNLRVLKVKGLRVVDASVMPKITNGNTNAPTIMIAERASDIIKGKPLLKKSSM